MLRCMKYIVALRRKIENSANASDSSIFLLGSLHFNASPHMFEKSAYSLLLGRTSSVSRRGNTTMIVITELLKTNVITSENFFEIFTNLAICWKLRVSSHTSNRDNCEVRTISREGQENCKEDTCTSAPHKVEILGGIAEVLGVSG